MAKQPTKLNQPITAYIEVQTNADKQIDKHIGIQRDKKNSNTNKHKGKQTDRYSCPPHSHKKNRQMDKQTETDLKV